MSGLIVNGDDFGLTAGVNRAIAELHEEGVLTSASLMARAAATEEAAEMARRTPTLGVGCHVVLADGEPVLPRGELPHLADARSGRLASTLAGFLERLARGGDALAGEIEREAAAQIAALRGRGLAPTHVDTHKHTHMFPGVLRAVLRAANAAGIRAVRNPFEPAWSLRATARGGWMRRMEVSLLRRRYERAFRRIVAEEGFATTDGAIGVLATGRLDAATIGSLVGRLPAGTWELVTHPGYHDGDLARVRTRLLASRETERAALRELRLMPNLELVSFAGLRGAAGEAE